MRETDECDVRLARERGLVRDQARHALAAVSVEARIERRRVAARQGIRPDRIQLELGVGQDAIERLLARVAGGTNDTDVRHLHSMHELSKLCG